MNTEIPVALTLSIMMWQKTFNDGYGGYGGGAGGYGGYEDME